VNSLEGYDGVVLGAPLYVGRPLDLAAFAAGLTPAAPEPRPEQVEQARKALIDALLPIGPVAATLFAGALDPETMGLAERALT
jgi:menaquinone-dependent protoporphyrinogen IX oxidase